MKMTALIIRTKAFVSSVLIHRIFVATPMSSTRLVALHRLHFRTRNFAFVAHLMSLRWLLGYCRETHKLIIFQQVVDIMLESNQLGIIEEADKFIETLTNPEQLHVYAGFTAQKDFMTRIGQHQNLHGELKPCLLKTFGSKFNACLAEALAIKHLQKTKEKFAGVMNVGCGWEPETLRSNGDSYKVYMFAAKEPFKRRNNKNTNDGAMRQVNRKQQRVPGRPFCITCQKTLATEDSLVAHMNLHLSPIFNCPYCNRSLTTQENLTNHLNKNHLRVYRCSKSGCDFVGTLADFYRSHFEVCLYFYCKYSFSMQHLILFTEMSVSACFLFYL